jgi:hypothetical protein
MNTQGTGFYTCKECHKNESLLNLTTTAHKERNQLGDRRNDGDSNCNCGDGNGPNGLTLYVYDDDISLVSGAKTIGLKHTTILVP